MKKKKTKQTKMKKKMGSRKFEVISKLICCQRLTQYRQKLLAVNVKFRHKQLVVSWSRQIIVVSLL